MEKVSRNDPCPCGSGKKFKKCCESKTSSRRPLTGAQVLTGSHRLSSLFQQRTAPKPDEPTPPETNS